MTGFGGTTTTVLEHARRLAAEGIAVDVLAEAMAVDRIRAAGATPRRIREWPLGGRLRRWSFARGAERRVRRERYALVHGHGDVRVQHVLSLHNCVHAAHEAIHGTPLPSASAVGRLHASILRAGAFQVLIANSELMAADVRSRFGVPAEKVRVVYPGHDPTHFNREDRGRHRDPMRAALGLGPDDFLAGLITSGDFRKRGVRIFLEALRHLPRTAAGPRLHLLIAGKERRMQDYAALARASDHHASIHLLEPRPDVERLYHALDLYVHPALYEEFGQSVQEALACGVPVLTGPRVGAAELLPAAVRGMAVVEPEPAALAQALARLMADAPARDAIREAGAAAARRNTWEVNWAATRRIYDEILMPAGL